MGKLSRLTIVNRKTVALHNRQCSSCSLLTIAKGRRSPLCRVIVQHDFQDIQHNKMARRRVYNLTVSRASSTPTLSSSANANCPVAPHCLPQGSLGTTTDAAPVQLLPVCMLVTWWGVFFFSPLIMCGVTHLSKMKTLKELFRVNDPSVRLAPKKWDFIPAVYLGMPTAQQREQ